MSTSALEFPAESADDPYSFVGGGSFLLDTPADPVPIWGLGRDVLWADGESVVVGGKQGLGKTGIAGQLTLGRCGFAEYSNFLGYPVMSGARRTLYLAMDRPRQIARSMRRMVGESWRDELDERLVVWQGPPPADLAKHTGLLRDLCRKADADTVVIDSLKDAAIGLTDDEVGSGYNRARQTAIAAGIQVLELHHQRKAVSGSKAEHPTLDDLYGSTWITSGAGSVVLLTGAPGDPIVSLHHLKQPAEVVGPLRVIHDSDTGYSEVWHATDLVVIAGAMPAGITALDAAKALFETDKPCAADREKARRRLDRLVSAGDLRVLVQGDKAANTSTRWGGR